MLAVDRTNEEVADLYLPYHPAILRALKRIVDVANSYEKNVSICGEMVHDAKYLRFLLGIGLRTLSMNPAYLPKIQHAIGTIDIGDAELFVKKVLAEKYISSLSEIFDGEV